MVINYNDNKENSKNSADVSHRSNQTKSLNDQRSNTAAKSDKYSSHISNFKSDIAKCYSIYRNIYNKYDPGIKKFVKKKMI